MPKWCHFINIISKGRYWKTIYKWKIFVLTLFTKVFKISHFLPKKYLSHKPNDGTGFIFAKSFLTVMKIWYLNFVRICQHCERSRMALMNVFIFLHISLLPSFPCKKPEKVSKNVNILTKWYIPGAIYTSQSWPLIVPRQETQMAGVQIRLV